MLWLFFIFKEISINKLELIIESNKSFSHIRLESILITTSNAYISDCLKLYIYIYEERHYILDEGLYLKSI